MSGLLRACVYAYTCAMCVCMGTRFPWANLLSIDATVPDAFQYTYLVLPSLCTIIGHLVMGENIIGM